jgi:hypothetical protein
MPADGEGLHALDETQQHRRGDGYGVVDPGSGACEVTVNSGVLAQSDTLTVASGDVLVDGTTHSLATQTLSLDAASATNPRRDVVYVDAAGAVQVAKGTAEAVEPEGQNLTRFEFYRPAPPDLATTDGTVLAEVWIPTGASSIGSADVRDRRLRALGPHSLDEDIATQTELDTHAGSADAHHTRPAAGDGLTDDADTFNIEPADFAGVFLSDDGSDNLQVDTDGTIEDDGSGNARVKERFNYDPGMTQLEDGQTDTELNRIVLQSGETLTIERIELRGQGGGSSSSVDIEVYDETASTSIGSQTLGGTTKDPGSSGTGNTVIIRYSNSSGSQSDAAPRVTGYIESA